MTAGDGFATGPGAASCAASIAESTSVGHAPAPAPPGTRGRGMRRLAAACLVALAAALPPATAEA